MNSTQRLEDNLRDTVFLAIKHTPEREALIVFDTRCKLSRILTEGYRVILPEAKFVDFDASTPDEIRQTIDALPPRSLVVLIQSSSFRLNEFRFRLELFNRSLAVIEHPHLGRMPESEHEVYIDALAYDKTYYHSVGPALKTKIDSAKKITVSCDGTTLSYEGPFESAKLNIGDYTEMKNTGGQFPIGEVFTEPADLAKVNGQVKIYAFGDREFHVIFPDTPILLTIENGIIVKTENAPDEFISIIDQIREDEVLTLRELGFGMNRAMTRTRFLTDIGSYERMCGIHLSLGGKHTIYAKAGFPKRSSKYHVDVFVDVTSVEIDGETVFKDGAYVL